MVLLLLNGVMVTVGPRYALLLFPENESSPVMRVEEVRMFVLLSAWEPVPYRFDLYLLDL